MLMSQQSYQSWENMLAEHLRLTGSSTKFLSKRFNANFSSIFEDGGKEGSLLTKCNICQNVVRAVTFQHHMAKIHKIFSENNDILILDTEKMSEPSTYPFDSQTVEEQTPHPPEQPPVEVPTEPTETVDNDEINMNIVRELDEKNELEIQKLSLNESERLEKEYHFVKKLDEAGIKTPEYIESKYHLIFEKLRAAYALPYTQSVTFLHKFFEFLNEKKQKIADFNPRDHEKTMLTRIPEPKKIKNSPQTSKLDNFTKDLLSVYIPDGHLENCQDTSLLNEIEYPQVSEPEPELYQEPKLQTETKTENILENPQFAEMYSTQNNIPMEDSPIRLSKKNRKGPIQILSDDLSESNSQILFNPALVLDTNNNDAPNRGSAERKRHQKSNGKRNKRSRQNSENSRIYSCTPPAIIADPNSQISNRTVISNQNALPQNMGAKVMSAAAPTTYPLLSSKSNDIFEHEFSNHSIEMARCPSSASCIIDNSQIQNSQNNFNIQIQNTGNNHPPSKIAKKSRTPKVQNIGNRFENNLVESQSQNFTVYDSSRNFLQPFLTTNDYYNANTSQMQPMFRSNNNSLSNAQIQQLAMNNQINLGNTQVKQIQINNNNNLGTPQIQQIPINNNQLINYQLQNFSNNNSLSNSQLQQYAMNNNANFANSHIQNFSNNNVNNLGQSQVQNFVNNNINNFVNPQIQVKNVQNNNVLNSQTQQFSNNNMMAQQIQQVGNNTINHQMQNMGTNMVSNRVQNVNNSQVPANFVLSNVDNEYFNMVNNIGNNTNSQTPRQIYIQQQNMPVKVQANPIPNQRIAVNHAPAQQNYVQQVPIQKMQQQINVPMGQNIQGLALQPVNLQNMPVGMVNFQGSNMNQGMATIPQQNSNMQFANQKPSHQVNFQNNCVVPIQQANFVPVHQNMQIRNVMPVGAQQNMQNAIQIQSTQRNQNMQNLSGQIIQNAPQNYIQNNGQQYVIQTPQVMAPTQFQMQNGQTVLVQPNQKIMFRAQNQQQMNSQTAQPQYVVVNNFNQNQGFVDQNGVFHLAQNIQPRNQNYGTIMQLNPNQTVIYSQRN